MPVSRDSATRRVILMRLGHDLVERAELTQLFAHVAQLVEHVLGKDGVAGSIPAVGF